MNFILPYLLLILQYEETGNNLYRILVIVSLINVFLIGVCGGFEVCGGFAEQ
jgi:hypothetical protein